MIFDSGVSAYQYRKNSIFKHDAASTGHPYRKKMNLDPYFKLYAKINSEWIIDLNVKGKSIKEFGLRPEEGS